MATKNDEKKPKGIDALAKFMPKSSGGSGKSSDVGSMPVYMGRIKKPKTPKTSGATQRARRNIMGLYRGTNDYGEYTTTVDQATAQFFKWGEKKRQDFIAQGVLTGLLPAGSGLMEASKLWRKMVIEAAAYKEAHIEMSPWDIMSAYVKQAGGENAWVRQGDFEVNIYTKERRYVGPRFKTTTDRRTDFTDPQTARAIATAVFQEMLGRNPGGGELGAFAKALAASERAHPVITTTTTEFDSMGEPIGTDTTQSGGLTAEARAMLGQNQIMKGDEYGAVQSATTYMGALEQLVYGAPG